MKIENPYTKVSKSQDPQPSINEIRSSAMSLGARRQDVSNDQALGLGFMIGQSIGNSIKDALFAPKKQDNANSSKIRTYNSIYKNTLSKVDSFLDSL